MSDITPLPIRLAVDEQRAEETRARANVMRWLTAPGKDLPEAMFEAAVGHAVAVIELQQAREGVADAEKEFAGLSLASPRAIVDSSRQRLDDARALERRMIFKELLGVGGLDAVRARVELIAASNRRGSDAQKMRDK